MPASDPWATAGEHALPYRTFTMRRSGDAFEVDYPRLRGVPGSHAYRRYALTNDQWSVSYPTYDTGSIRRLAPFLTTLAGTTVAAVVVVVRSVGL